MTRSTRPGKNVGVTIFLCPVYDPDPASENAQFFRWTPWGRIELGTVNPAAAAHFSQGAEVYVDLHAGDRARARQPLNRPRAWLWSR
jgi:hypothetical protein